MDQLHYYLDLIDRMGYIGEGEKSWKFNMALQQVKFT